VRTQDECFVLTVPAAGLGGTSLTKGTLPKLDSPFILDLIDYLRNDPGRGNQVIGTSHSGRVSKPALHCTATDAALMLQIIGRSINCLWRDGRQLRGSCCPGRQRPERRKAVAACGLG
jgi:hypothetical protein